MSTSSTETDNEVFQKVAGIMGFWLVLVIVIGFLLILFGDVLTVLT